MRGTFYDEVRKDRYTGETIFRLAPDEPCSFAVDGLVLCSGTIHDMPYKLPLDVHGYYSSLDRVFHAERVSTIPEDERALIRMLRWAAPNLTKAQTESIAAIGWDALAACIRAGDTGIIARAAGDRKAARVLSGKLRHVLDSGELSDLLILKYRAPAETVERLVSKGKTARDVMDDPFILCRLCGAEIGLADAIFLGESGGGVYDTVRMEGYVSYAIKRASAQGHTCMELGRLLTAVNWLLGKAGTPGIGLPLLYMYVSGMPYVVTDEWDGGVYVYEKHIYEEEQTAIAQMRRLSNSARPLVGSPDVGDAEREFGIRYTAGQAEAFRCLCTCGVKVLTGPPGTGKTAVVRGLIHEYKRNFPSGKLVRLAATTGKAAQVMAAASGCPAETVHRMLDIRPFDTERAGRYADGPVAGDFIIVDEASMMGLQLFSILLSAVRNGAILLLVGDEDQLQSVEYGCVLKDIIRSGCVSVFRLREVMRQSGTIYGNAVKVNSGDPSAVQDGSFRIFRFGDEGEALRAFRSMGLPECMVLSPIKGTACGTRSLNRLMQQRDGEPLLRYGGQEYYAGDPVIMCRTDYGKGFMNGDTGKVVGKDGDGLIVQFQDRRLCIGREDFHSMDLAYAVTIHRAQGSEADVVAIFLPDACKNMLTRRILYTAITRARERVVIFSVRDAFGTAVSNSHDCGRLTLLAEKLQENTKNGHI